MIDALGFDSLKANAENFYLSILLIAKQIVSEYGPDLRIYQYVPNNSALLVLQFFS